ncbi:bacillithiol system redox-active protein YtxJ [Marivirga sp. S37H4]|uniref:Bacillithiol system redox-active protein YtxJ n=1 Tax=Marivirga aurantiaca TaxID=2802615 RepID=A0A934X080_9BACT|nr:bacillithiol system redox-active protein YtxJ [Marivirga aurantiaca]
MNWKKLNNVEMLQSIAEDKSDKSIIIFKHSTSCSISSMALNRLERSWDENEMAQVEAYYLDLLSYRDVSNAIAEKFGIEHQSPQILVIKNGSCIYDNSHMGINYQALKEEALA